MKPHETTAQCVERKLGRKLRLIRVDTDRNFTVIHRNLWPFPVFSGSLPHQSPAKRER